MPDYLLVHDRQRFEADLRPALATAWQRRTFRGCTPLLMVWQEAARDYAQRYHIDPAAIFLIGFYTEMPFEPYLWRALVGELLVVTAIEMPELPGNLESLERLLAPSHPYPGSTPLAMLPPGLQAVRGCEELTFGLATYRPGFAGYNSALENRRLRDHLRSIDPSAWSAETLLAHPPLAEAEDCFEELAFAREWFARLVELYEHLVAEDVVLIFETVYG